MNSADVVVVGGGPAGASASILLARSGLRTAVLVSDSPLRPRPVEMLNSEGGEFLKELGFPEELLGPPHLLCQGVRSRWADDRVQEVHVLANPYGQAWHLDRTRFDADFAAFASAQGAAFIAKAKVVSLEFSKPGLWHLTYQQGERRSEICAPFIIDATGRSSAIGHRLGSSRRYFDRLVARLLLFESTPEFRECDAFSQVEACSDGWWHAARISGNRITAVYFTDGDLARKTKPEHRCGWEQALESAPAMKEFLSGARLLQDFGTQDAGSNLLWPFSGEAWLAVGDAAMALDPLSGQGLMSAFRSAREAADTISDWFGGHRERIEGFERNHLRRFERFRAEQLLHYGRVRRWPKSQFWTRRSEGMEGHSLREPLDATSLDWRTVP